MPPRRRQQGNRAREPYKQVMSSLLKPDLVRLCRDFELPSDGSVAILRNRLKDHMNRNRERLYRDPIYNGLFPKFRKPHQAPPSPTPPPPPPSPTLSYVSAASDVSWQGIGGHDNAQAPFIPQDLPPAIHNHHHQAPLHQLSPQPHNQHDHPFNHYQDPPDLFLPPSPFPFNPQPDLIPPVVQPVDGRKFLSHALFAGCPLSALACLRIYTLLL
jgi:hypothetical protein